MSGELTIAKQIQGGSSFSPEPPRGITKFAPFGLILRTLGAIVRVERATHLGALVCFSSVLSSLGLIIGIRGRKLISRDLLGEAVLVIELSRSKVETE